MGERNKTENYPCPKDYEFVWFDENETIKDIGKLSAKPDESDLDKQMKKLFESNTNMLL